MGLVLSSPQFTSAIQASNAKWLGRERGVVELAELDAHVIALFTAMACKLVSQGHVRLC